MRSRLHQRLDALAELVEAVEKVVEGEHHPGRALHLGDLDNASLKKGTKLIWLSTGKDDGLIAATKTTVDILKKHGFAPVFIESPGAHSWFNWRNYLIQFTPQLFQ